MNILNEDIICKILIMYNNRKCVKEKKILINSKLNVYRIKNNKMLCFVSEYVPKVI